MTLDVPCIVSKDPPNFTDYLIDGVCDYLCATCQSPCQEVDTGQWFCPDADYNPTDENCRRNSFFVRAGDEIVKFQNNMNMILEEARNWL